MLTNSNLESKFQISRFNSNLRSADVDLFQKKNNQSTVNIMFIKLLDKTELVHIY